jgi:endonuclease/exonuclease/phosphatase (EEP) superfamily protein YafD
MKKMHIRNPFSSFRIPRPACRLRCGALLGLAAIQPVACLLARFDYRADLLSHFQALAWALTAAAVIAALVWGYRRTALVLIVLAAWQVAPLVALALASRLPAEPDGPRLRVLVANVLVDNLDHQRILDLIQRERPDLIGLIEVDEGWLLDLAGLEREYPYRIATPDGPQGLALWSRRPWINAGGIERPTPDGWPFLHAAIDFDGQPLQIWLVHPSSPLRRWGNAGNPELAAIANRVAGVGGRRVVIGDLNCTEGSPHFADFLDAGGLYDSRMGFGLQASWPTWSPFRIAIDHALVTPDLAVVDRRLGPEVGSDHLPLILKLAPAATSAVSSEANDSQ